MALMTKIYIMKTLTLAAKKMMLKITVVSWCNRNKCITWTKFYVLPWQFRTHLDEDVPDQDNEYLEFLQQQSALHANDEDEFDDYEEEIEEEILFESPLDEINPYIRFEQIFRTMQQTNPASYTLLTKDLDADQQSTVMTILSNAEQQRTQQQQPTA